MKNALLGLVVLGFVSLAQAGVYIEFSGLMTGNYEGEAEAWRWCIGDSYAWEWFENCEFTATSSNAGFLDGKDLSKLKLTTGMNGLAAAILTWFRKTSGTSDHRLYTGGEFEIAYDGVKLVSGDSDTEVDVDYILNKTTGSINGRASDLFNGPVISGADFAAAFNSENNNNQWRATILTMSPVIGYTYETTIRLESQDEERHVQAFVPDIDIPVLLEDAQVSFKFVQIPDAGGGHVSAVRKIALPSGSLPAGVDPLSVTQYWSVGSSLVSFSTALSLSYDTNTIHDTSHLCVYRRADASNAWQQVTVAAVSNGMVTVTNVTQFSDWIVGLEESNDPVLPAALPESVSQADRQMYADWISSNKVSWGASDFSGLPATDFLTAWLLGQKPVSGYAAGVSLHVTAFEPLAHQPCETNGLPVAWRPAAGGVTNVVRVVVELSSGGVKWNGAVNGNLVIQSASSLKSAWLPTVGQTNTETRLSFANGVADVAFNRPTNGVFYRPVLAREGRASVTGRIKPWGAAVTNVWMTCVVDDAVTNGLYTSMAFNASGTLGICYYDSLAKDLKYAAFDGTVLSTQRVDTAGDVGKYCDLAFTSAGWPAISYYDAMGYLKYAAYNGSSWSIQNVDTAANSVGQYTSLALQTNGYPAISYQAYSNSTYRLKYAQYNGAAWSFQTLDSNNNGAQYTSLAFSPAGRPAIAYYDYQRDYVKYAYYNGTSWSLENTYTRYTSSLSMAFATNGWPSITHVDFLSLTGNLIYHSRGLYSSWDSSVTVDSLGSGASDGHVSLAFAPDGYPAISYYDEVNKNLKYAKYNGAQWVRTVIDSPGDVGQYTSLAFSPQGRPAISYYDKTNGKLKIAQYVEVALVPE
jgi:hypothetical protein